MSELRQWAVFTGMFVAAGSLIGAMRGYGVVYGGAAGAGILVLVVVIGGLLSRFAPR